MTQHERNEQSRARGQAMLNVYRLMCGRPEASTMELMVDLVHTTPGESEGRYLILQTQDYWLYQYLQEREEEWTEP